MVRRGFRILAVVLVSVASALVLAPTGSGAATPGDAPTWTVTTPPEIPTGDPFQAMSCPDVAHCWATDIEGGIYDTSDGGGNWYEQYGLGGGDDFWSIACPTVENCVAASPAGPESPSPTGTVVWTDDGGLVWTTSTSSPSMWGTGSLSCPSATVCYAGGSQRGVAVSSDGGQTWTQLQTPAVVGEVSCPTVSTCFGLSDYGMVVTRDGGSTWNTVSLPSSSLPASQLTCPTTTTCIAVGTYSGDIFQTGDGGATWQQESPPVADLSYSPVQGQISCPSSTTCYITARTNTTPQAGVVLESTDGGDTWTSLSLPTNDVYGTMSCPTVLVCYVDGLGFGGLGPNTQLSDVGPVTSVTATLDPATVGAVATVTTTFTTTDIGALGPGGSIVLYAPKGEAFPSDPSDYTVTDGTGTNDVIGSVTPDQGDPSQVTVVLSQSGITDDDSVSVTVTGFTNPTPTSDAWTLDVSTSADPVPSPSPPITLNAGPVSLPNSSVVATPDVAPADGSAPSTVVVSLADSYGNGVPDQSVTLAQGPTHAVITPATAVTDASGQAVFSVTDATSETVPLTATDTTDGTVVGAASIFFGGAVPTTTTLSSSSNPSVGGQPVTFSATVSPAPEGGSVAFTSNSVSIPGCAAAPVDALGVAQCTTAGLEAWGYPGSLGDTIVAQYTDVPPQGAVDYDSSTASLLQFVSFPTATALPDATAGAPYSQQLPATTAAPATWHKIRGTLPKGIALQSTGLLTGTPTARAASRVYSFTARVTYGSGSAGGAIKGDRRTGSHATEKFTLTVLSPS